MAKHKKKKKTGKKKKDDLGKRLEKGIRFFSEEEYDKARAIFTAILKSHPDNNSIFNMLAETMVRSGDMEEGKAMYEEAFSRDVNVWSTWRLANILTSSKDNDRARSVLEECLEKKPKNPWAYLNLASFYRNSGQLDKAMEILDKATTCAAELPILWGLVQVLLEQEPTPEIAGQFSKFLVLTPKHWQDYYLLSRCFIRQEQLEKALEVQNKSISFMKNEMNNLPKYLYLYYSKILGYIYLEKTIICFLTYDFDEVVASALNVLRHNPDLWECKYFLGVGYLYQGLLDKGRNALSGYLKEIDAIEDENLKSLYEPVHLSTNLLMGQSYISQSAFNEAIEVYKGLIKDKPEIEEAYLNAGYSYYCLGNINSSKDMFKSLLELKKNNLVALNNLGFLEMHDRNFEAAKDYFRKAIEVSPDYPLPYANLGFILTVEGDYEEAEEILLKALGMEQPEEASLKTLYPSSKEENIKMGGAPIEENQSISSHVSSLCNLGTTFARRKNYKDAHFCFDKLIAFLPDSHYGYRGKAWTSFLENDIKSALTHMRKAFETNSDNKALYEEYKFIQGKSEDIAETRKMASVLEGFFTEPEEGVSSSKSDDFKNVIENIKISDIELGEDLGVWDSLLIDKPHALTLEKIINKPFEDEIKVVEMISSWRSSSSEEAKKV